MRFIGGKRIMAELKKIVYKEFDERLMVGVHYHTSFFEAGNVWKSYFESDKIDYLKKLSEFTSCEDIDENDGIGMMFNFQDTNTFELILGDFMKVNTPVPHELHTKHIPSGTVACIQIEGNNISEIVDSAFLLITEAIEKNDKEIDFDHFYWCEVYTKQRYSIPLSRGEKVVIDYILPVKSKLKE
jgi:AraC family transcriptional regulator